MQDSVCSAPEGTVVQVTGKVLARPKQNINLVSILLRESHYYILFIVYF